MWCSGSFCKSFGKCLGVGSKPADNWWQAMRHHFLRTPFSLVKSSLSLWQASVRVCLLCPMPNTVLGTNQMLNTLFTRSLHPHNLTEQGTCLKQNSLASLFLVLVKGINLYTLHCQSKSESRLWLNLLYSPPITKWWSKFDNFAFSISHKFVLCFLAPKCRAFTVPSWTVYFFIFPQYSLNSSAACTGSRFFTLLAWLIFLPEISLCHPFA